MSARCGVTGTACAKVSLIGQIGPAATPGDGAPGSRHPPPAPAPTHAARATAEQRQRDSENLSSQSDERKAIDPKE